MPDDDHRTTRRQGAHNGRQVIAELRHCHCFWRRRIAAAVTAVIEENQPRRGPPGLCQCGALEIPGAHTQGESVHEDDSERRILVVVHDTRGEPHPIVGDDRILLLAIDGVEVNVGERVCLSRTRLSQLTRHPRRGQPANS